MKTAHEEEAAAKIGMRKMYLPVLKADKKMNLEENRRNVTSEGYRRKYKKISISHINEERRHLLKMKKMRQA